ncbi:histone acetyltransferase type B catalytic subunit-like [Primulina eburnea]|uniref:histone acetyltransferase type B catalytic subunit-like n=1 Tax=Primulina eburnea TaxID=1245227 RepID=UPI003C6C2138
MGTKHHSSSDPIFDQKKRRRVGFSKSDAGVEANECIKIYLVSNKEEVDSPDSFQIEPVDLNHFFEEDGRIYGFQGLQINVWISSVSLHSYADISFDSSSDGGKGKTDLKSSLQNIFAQNLFEKKDDFLQTFSSEYNYVKNIVSSAGVLQNNASNSCNSNSTDCWTLKYVYYCATDTGSNPIDVTDSSWQIYVQVGKGQQDSCNTLLGFAAVYRFHRYPTGMRLRLGQILIVPPYQRKGYGRTLLKVLNNVAISENACDLTIEEPVDSLQHVRACIDVQHLLDFESIHKSLDPLVSLLKHKTCQEQPANSMWTFTESVFVKPRVQRCILWKLELRKWLL